MITDFLHIQKSFIFCLVLFLISFDLYAQPLKKFSSQNYTVNEGLLTNRIVDIVEDNNDFIWISAGAGLQRFDGRSFETISTQEGLPETNHPHFFKLKDGTLWLSYFKGISAYNSITNRFKIVFNDVNNFKQISGPQQYEISPLMPEIECGQLVWCWSVFKHKFFAINKTNYRLTDSFQLPRRLSPYVSDFRVGPDGFLFFSSELEIVGVRFENKQVFHIKPKPLVPHYSAFSFRNKAFIITRRGLYKIDIPKSSYEHLIAYPFGIDTGHIEQVSVNYLYDNFFALSLNNELYLFNADTGEFIYRMVNGEDKPLLSLGYINSCMIDNYKHLWVVTGVHGLIKINFNKQGIKYYGNGSASTNFTRCIYPDKKNNLIIAGQLFNNISVYDTNQTVIKHFTLPPNTASCQVSCIFKIQPLKYLIFLSGDPSILLFDAIKWKFTPLKNNLSTDYYSTVQRISDSSFLLFSPYHISSISYINQHLQIKTLLTKKFFLCGLLNTNKQLWLAATGKYFILSGKKFENEKVFSLKENVVTKCLFQDKQGTMWMGTEKGLYKFDGNKGEILWVYKKADGLADENIYSIIDDDSNNIWFSTNKGISCLTADNRVINIYGSDGLQGSEFNGNSSAKSGDGELFFGGINGFNSFYPDIMKTIAKRPNIVMSKIKVMDDEWHSDTASWNLHEINLSYTQNVISFSFNALGWYSPEVYNYQYKMNGIDKQWVNAGNTGYARYILPPGKYKFEYTADNRFEKNTSYKKYITIIITPPFWQTTWFKIIIIAGIVLLLVVLVRLYEKQKYKRQLREIEIQQTLQKERQRISRDLHDNIGAYTTVLIAGTEQLKNKVTDASVQQSANTISENAKNIVGSLQETIWVLNNNAITITDFLDRCKVYAKKILQSYPNVHIKFHEQLSNDKVLSPLEALNIFRIIQETLQNALKHSKASLIDISVESDKLIKISIKDNGAGFNTSLVSTGSGLFNMKHRAREAGYKIDVVSGENGTEVLLEK